MSELVISRRKIGASVDAVVADSGSHLYSDALDSDDAPMDSAEQADRRDVLAVRKGDRDAYGRLVSRHQERIAKLMWRFTRDAGVLEELVQDAFVEAYRSLEGFDASRPLGPWLSKIAVRAGYRHWKMRGRRQREVPLESVGELSSPGEPTTPSEAGELVKELLAGLPPRDRMVLTLMYLEGRSVKQIAELTGWSVVMVKVQAHRARGKLRKVLESSKEEEGSHG